MAYTVVDKGSKYFNTVLYTGDGTTSRSITGVGFQPDWVWVKGRSTAYYHGLWDAVRTNKSALYSNATDAEDTTTGGTLGSFNSDGFTTPSVSGGFINNSGTTYASWHWLGANTTVSNTSGSITSTVSANTTSGFSIVKWASSSYSDTIGHGLGVAPAMIIAKETSISRGWFVYHKSLGNSYYINLNTTGAAATPNSGRIEVSGSNTFICGTDGTNQIAYCFAEVKGFSKFGSYTGNGSADGTFVYTGFSPAFVMYKNSSDGTTAWSILDNKRSTFNVISARLFAESSSAEDSSVSPLDFTSNGFKVRSTNAGVNGSGNTIIYMAFAQNPFVSSKGIPTTAR